MLFGAIEAGGTKCICAVGNGNMIEKRIAVPTGSVQDTLEAIYAFFDAYTMQAIGIGSFGPLDLQKSSPTYGYITTTPKQGWAHTPLVRAFQDRYRIPIGFDTDVNAAALGEQRWGAAKGLDSCLYLTVGTGIGGGAMLDNRLLHGLLHPEMGHIMMQRHPADTFGGVCPYHGDCFEGLCSGVAMEQRWKTPADQLSPNHPAWDMEAWYIAQALRNYICTLMPKKIILGGGVMHQEQLFPLIHQHLLTELRGYLQIDALLAPDNYIVKPGLGDDSGIIGALALAEAAR